MFLFTKPSSSKEWQIVPHSSCSLQMKTQLLKYIYTLQRPIGYKSVSSETPMNHRQKDPAVSGHVYHTETILLWSTEKLES